MSTHQAISHYEILGLPEQASHQDIESAYRAELAKVRASLSGGSPLPASVLDQLRNAYHTLGDADRRQAYDHLRQAATTEAASPPATSFEFAGSGASYFRIWIVNLLLTVVTLGIYSAWAKVRREQYFHRNTLLAGSGFDYHGKPRAILKGRLIAWGLLAAMSVSQKFSPVLYGVLVLCAIPILPWLLMRSLKFRAANTSYRGLRFRHRGTYGQALGAFVGHGLLVLVTLGFWMPLWTRAIKRFQIGKLSFAGTDFSCEPRAGGFYGAYLLTGLTMAGVTAILGVAVALAMPALGPGSTKEGAFLIGAAFPVVFLLLITLFVRPFLQVRLANLTWNASTLGGRRFVSRQGMRTFWPIHASNLLFILLTLGLYWPWAKVREAAYRVRHLAIEATDFDAFVGRGQQENSAVGEEIADVFDLDFSL